MLSGSPSWRERGRAVLAYLGLLPVLRLIPVTRTSPYLRHHDGQAAVIGGLFVLLVGLLLVTLLALSYALVAHRELYENAQLERYSLGAVRKLFLAWSVFWLFGLGMALLGAARPMPLVQPLAERKRVVGAATSALGALLVLVVLLLLAGGYAARRIPPDRTAARVYMVYEDNGIFPRAMFALAFLPMARAADEVYGPGSAALLPISREAVATALAGGDVVFVGSHGTERGLMLRDDWLLPRDLAAMAKGPNLKFVYLTGCDSGVKRDDWLNALAPAEVVTYDRLSASLEHAWWLWFNGPDKVRAIAGVPEE